jgi:predicted alpha/beta hydrolase
MHTVKQEINEVSHFIEKVDFKLHLKRFCGDNEGPVIMLLHGSIENGKIFYSKSGKGLAPFLASKGFDVFIPDLRGKGLSMPSVSKTSTDGQYEAIVEDLPSFVDKIQTLRPGAPMHWMAHSWGGVLLLSFLARFGNPGVKSMVFFATKRDVRVQNWRRWINIDLLWNMMGRYLAWRYGYLPVTKFGIGSDNEPKNFFHEVNHLVYSKKWIDPRDQFDYNSSILKADLPPTLYLTGSKDTHSGNAYDVKRLKKEVGDREKDAFVLLSKDNGHLADYDHINILTHPKAGMDVYELALKWMKEQRIHH